MQPKDGEETSPSQNLQVQDIQKGLDRLKRSSKIPEKQSAKDTAEAKSLAAHTAHKEAETSDVTANTKLKIEYSRKAFRFLVAWCTVVVAFLVLQGFGLRGFELSDTVLSVVVGTTTVNAIALVGFVVKGTFK